MSGIARLFTRRVDGADSIEFPVDQRDDFTVKVATCQESNEFFFATMEARGAITVANPADG